jgi:hypothetical protein
MERAIIITDGISGQLFAIVTEKARILSFFGTEGAGEEWAKFSLSDTKGSGKLETLTSSLDYGLIVEGPKSLTRQVRAKITELIAVAPEEQEEPDELLSATPVIASSDTPLITQNAKSWKSHLNYKALAWDTDVNVASFGYELKVRKPIPFDLPNGGRGFRCPPGMANGGAFTDRFGRNCGTAATRRLINAMGSIGEGTRVSRRASTRGRASRDSSAPEVPRNRATRRTGARQVASQRGLRNSPASEGDRAPSTRNRLGAARTYPLTNVLRTEFNADIQRLNRARTNRNFSQRAAAKEVIAFDRLAKELKNNLESLPSAEQEEAQKKIRHAERMASQWQDVVDHRKRFTASKWGEGLSEADMDDLLRQRRIWDRDLFELAEEDAAEDVFLTSAQRLSLAADAQMRTSQDANLPKGEQEKARINGEHLRRLADIYESIADTVELDATEKASRRSKLLSELIEVELKIDRRNKNLYAEKFQELADRYAREASLREEAAQEDDELTPFEKQFNEMLAERFSQVSLEANSEAEKRRKDGNVAPIPDAIEEEVTQNIALDSRIVQAIKEKYEQAAAAFERLFLSASSSRQGLVGRFMRDKYGDDIPPPWLAGLASEDELWTEVAILGQSVEDPYEPVDSDFIYNWARSIWEHDEIKTRNFTFRTRISDEGVSAFPEDGEIYINGEIEAYDQESQEWRRVGEFLRRISENSPGTIFSEELKLGSGMLYILRDSEGIPMRDSEGNYLRRDGDLTEAQRKDVAFGDLVRGDGFASLFNGHAFALLSASGFARAEVNAVDDGAYVWGRVGYRSSNANSIRALVSSMADALKNFRSGNPSIVNSTEQAEMIEYLIELSKASNYAYEAPQWPEFIAAISAGNMNSDRKRQIKEWFQDHAPFDRGVLPFTPDIVAPDPRILA